MIIYIRDLKLSCLIGVHPHERLAPQTLCAQVELTLSDLKACESDELSDTVSYSGLAEHLLEIARTHQPLLIERLGKLLLDACLNFDPRIIGAQINLEKPGCIQGAKSAGVILSSGASTRFSHEHPCAE